MQSKVYVHDSTFVTESIIAQLIYGYLRQLPREATFLFEAFMVIFLLQSNKLLSLAKWGLKSDCHCENHGIHSDFSPFLSQQCSKCRSRSTVSLQRCALQQGTLSSFFLVSSFFLAFWMQQVCKVPPSKKRRKKEKRTTWDIILILIRS